MFSQIYGGSVHFYIASHHIPSSRFVRAALPGRWEGLEDDVSSRFTELLQCVKPTSQAIHHLPNCSMEIPWSLWMTMPTIPKKRFLQGFTGLPPVQVWILPVAVSPKKKPSSVFSENRIPSLQDCCFNTIFPSKISYLGYPNLNIRENPPSPWDDFRHETPTMPPIYYYVMKQ